MTSPPRQTIRRRRRSAGFTLIEVMIALVVFAVGALTLAAIIPLGVKKTTNAGGQTRASELAAKVAERLLDTPTANPDLAAGIHADTVNPYWGNYFVLWTVELDQPIANCRRITVDVRHPTVATVPPISRLVVVKN